MNTQHTCNIINMHQWVLTVRKVKFLIRSALVVFDYVGGTDIHSIRKRTLTNEFLMTQMAAEEAGLLEPHVRVPLCAPQVSLCQWLGSEHCPLMTSRYCHLPPDVDGDDLGGVFSAFHPLDALEMTSVYTILPCSHRHPPPKFLKQRLLLLCERYRVLL